MDAATRREAAEALMTSFAKRTAIGEAAEGSGDGRSPRRYLWTDAHAVSNFLALGRRDLAVALVDDVHHVLGRHRPDDPRQGWISGLDEEAGRRHPTAGGLRIGKPRPERRPGEPYDPQAEWDRDGQYFHYLTRWMHALARVAAATGEERYHRWAVELATTAQRGFTWTSRADGAPRMVWKMSIDLSRPLVPSRGENDPLDGWITALGLRAAAPPGKAMPQLAETVEVLSRICCGPDAAPPTDDPLGLGGLLADAWRLAQLRDRGVDDGGMVERLVDAARRSLELVTARAAFSGPATYRLAFRELGLAIGLAAAERLVAWIGDDEALAASAAVLRNSLPLRQRIESFWLDGEQHRSRTWTRHRDINEVMLASALVPDVVLET